MSTVFHFASHYGSAQDRPEKFETIQAFTKIGETDVFFKMEKFRSLMRSELMVSIKNKVLGYVGPNALTIASIVAATWFSNGGGGLLTRGKKHENKSRDFIPCSTTTSREEFDKEFDRIFSDNFTHPATAVVDVDAKSFTVVIPEVPYDQTRFSKDVFEIDESLLESDDAIHPVGRMSSLAQIRSLMHGFQTYFDFAFRAYPQSMRNITNPEALVRIKRMHQAISKIGGSQNPAPKFFQSICD